MLKEEIQKRINGKMEGLDENLKYVMEAVCDIQSSLSTIRYLQWLISKDDEKKDDSL